jgi:hypothetical protein
MKKKHPTPVELVSPTPVPVAFVGQQPYTGIPRQSQTNDPSLPAKTTFQEDLTTAGQRRINLIWEYTQAIIALTVVVTTMVGSIYGMVKSLPMPTIIAVAFGTVVGFYFSRTNHAAIGGVGRKPPDEHYTGR